MNISPHARWVVCPLGSTRGHAQQVIYPLRRAGRFENREKKIPCSNGCFPAAWPLGQQREEQGDLFIFFLLCSPCFGRRRNSILPYAPNHLAYSPQRYLTATILPRRSMQVRYIHLHSSSIRLIMLDISETLTPSNPRSLSVRSTFDDR